MICLTCRYDRPESEFKTVLKKKGKREWLYTLKHCIGCANKAAKARYKMNQEAKGEVVHPRGIPQVDLTNVRFGRLTALRAVPMEETGLSGLTWACKCDCGVTKFVNAPHLLSGFVKSCGCGRPNGRSYDGWDGRGEITGNHWSSIVKSAENRVIPFTLRIDEAWNKFVEQDECCALTGVFLIMPHGNKAVRKTCSASLDRINSSKGYSVDNVQWVHKDVNIMKWALPQDHFIRMSYNVAQTNEYPRTEKQLKYETMNAKELRAHYSWMRYSSHTQNLGWL